MSLEPGRKDPSLHAGKLYQDGWASQGGEVNQLGQGTQINGLSGKAAIGIVAAAMSIALAAVLVFTTLNSPDQPRADSPRSPGDGQVAGTADGVKAVLSLPREGGLDASKYLPTDGEERDYFSKIGEGAEKAGYASFVERQHLVHVGGDSYKLSVVNTGKAPIRVVEIKPVSLHREEPISEVLYYPVGGAGGEEGVIADLDLDDPRPYLALGRAEYFAGHSVPIQPADAFDIFIRVRTLKCYCTYSLEVQYIDSGGSLKSLLVQHPNRRTGRLGSFEVTAALAGTSKYQRAYKPKLDDPRASMREASYVRVNPPSGLEPPP
ncbi:hypothetical protein ACIPW5_14585 [Streptomyces sp. NPDC090077]|uniref:hypothetical protein n=1 Tax=Streptomyces sp. NPDC090077 TaxID=3365938 RepID=UPI0037FD860A